MSKVKSFEHTTVTLSNSEFNANHCTIRGSGNTITGNHLNIDGDNNVAHGNHLRINGSGNIAFGDHIFCNGTKNQVTGKFSSVYEAEDGVQSNATKSSGFIPMGSSGPIFNMTGQGFSACNISNSAIGFSACNISSSAIGHGATVSFDNSFNSRPISNFISHEKVKDCHIVFSGDRSSHVTTRKKRNVSITRKSTLPNFIPESSINKSKSHSSRAPNTRKSSPEPDTHTKKLYNSNVGDEYEGADVIIDCDDDREYYLSEGEEEYVLNPDTKSVYYPRNIRGNLSATVADISKNEQRFDNSNVNLESKFKIEYSEILSGLERTPLSVESVTLCTSTRVPKSDHDKTFGTHDKGNNVKIGGRNCVACKTGPVETLFLDCCHSMLCVRCSFNENAIKELFCPITPVDDTDTVNPADNEYKIRCPFSDCSKPVSRIVKIK